MTREEQIEREALLDYDAYADNNYHAFKRGVTWADEHPNLYNDEKYHTVQVSCLDDLYRKVGLYETFLEKACEYIRTHLWQNVDSDNDPIVESIRNITLDDFIKDFKRYLDE